MRKILILLIVFIASCDGKSQNKYFLEDTVKLSDFKWIIAFEGGSDVSNIELNCSDKTILIKEYDFRLRNEPINRFEIDSLGNKIVTSKDFDKNGLRVSSYLKSEDTVIQFPRTYHQISTYHIPLTDTTKIKKLSLKYTLKCPRGCDLESSLLVNFEEKELLLTFPNIGAIGAIRIHDIVQYDATSFVISFWYYKRGGGEWISDVRVGLLDLTQYLK